MGQASFFFFIILSFMTQFCRHWGFTSLPSPPHPQCSLQSFNSCLSSILRSPSYCHGDEDSLLHFIVFSFFPLNLRGTVPKERDNGSAAETRISTGRNSEKYIPVLAIQRWTRSETTDKALRCWDTSQGSFLMSFRI